MTRLGTAFVSVEADFDKFNRQVAQKFAGSFRGAGEQASKDFSDGFGRGAEKNFNQHTSGILVPLAALQRDVAKSTEKATTSLKRQSREFAATAKTATDAKQAVEGVGKTLSAVGDLSPQARIDIQIAGADAQIGRIREHLAELSAKNPTVEIKVASARAIADLERVEAFKRRLVADREQIKVELDRKTFDETFAAINRLRDASKAAALPQPGATGLRDLFNARATPNPFARDGAASLQAPSPPAGSGAHELPARNALDLTPKGRVDLKLAAADAEVQQLRAHLTELGTQSPTIEVRVAIAKALVDLDRAELKAKTLAAERVNIKVDVDQSLFSRITESFQGLFAAAGGSGGGGGLSGATTRLSAGFISFGSAVGPVAALLGALAVTVGVALVGAFAAVVASMALAAAGAAALGAAFAAVLGPVVVLAIATVSRVAKVFAALKAQDAAASQIGQGAAAGSQAAAAAAAQQAAAARGLTEANRQLGLATSGAYREMADAAEKASDSIRGIADAQQSLDQAKLSTEQASLALQQFRQEAGATGQAFGAVFQKFTDVSVDTSGLKAALAAANQAQGGKLDQGQELELRQKILDVRAARLREKDATDGVSDAITASTRAQQDNNRFKREGIKASESYRAALRGVQSATLAVKAAQDQQGSTAAQQKAIDLTGKLSAKEQQLLVVLRKVRGQLRGAFTPATDAVLGGVTSALGRLPALINPLRGSFKRLGTAIGHAFDQFSADIVKPETISLFQKFTDGAAKLAGPIADGISLLLDIFLRIANAALPFLIDGTRKVGDQLFRWSEGTKNTRQLDKTIKSLVDHLKVWLGVGGSIANVFLAFLPAAAGAGDGLAASIKRVADRTTAWLKDDGNRAKVRDFLDKAVALTKRLAEFMAALLVATVKFASKASEVLSTVVDGMGGAKNAANALLFAVGALAVFKFAKGLIGGIRDIASAMRAANQAATLLHASWNAGALAAARQKAALIASKIATLAMTAASKAFAAAEWLVNIALRANPIGLIITALVALGAGLVIAYKHSETFRRIVDGAFAAVKKAVVVAIQGILFMFDKLLGGYSSIATGLSHIPLIGDKFKGAANAIDGAREKLRGFSKSLNDLPKNKEIKIRAKVSGLVIDGHTFIRPSGPANFATGGPVAGRGSRDTVPAWLTPGEYVNTEQIVRRLGFGVFADINAGRLDPRVGYAAGERPSVGMIPVKGSRFASGGLVGAGVSQPQTVNHHHEVPIHVAGGGYPDVEDLAMKLDRRMQRFGGPVRQD